MNTLKYKGYTGTVAFDPDAKLFHGHVIDLNDVITFQSQDATKLEEEFHISVDTYLEFCEELGDEPAKPYSGKFNVRISPELHRLASVKAVRKDMSLNTFVAYAIEAAVAKDSKSHADMYASYDGIWIDKTLKVRTEGSLPCDNAPMVSLRSIMSQDVIENEPIEPLNEEGILDDEPAA